MTITLNPPVTLRGAPGQPVVTLAEVEDAPPMRLVSFPQVPSLGQIAVECVGSPEDSVAAIANPGPQKEHVPASVASWAFLVVIRAMGKEAALNAAIAAYTGADANRVRAKWQRDPRIDRDGATVDSLGAAIGLTPEQVDQVFRDAWRTENQ